MIGKMVNGCVNTRAYMDKYIHDLMKFRLYLNSIRLIFGHRMKNFSAHIHRIKKKVKYTKRFERYKNSQWLYYIRKVSLWIHLIIGKTDRVLWKCFTQNFNRIRVTVMRHAEETVYTLWLWGGSIRRKLWYCSGPVRRRIELADCFWWKSSI